MSDIVVYYGRFNPVHNGHMVNISQGINRLSILTTKNLILTTKSHDSNRNPLSPSQKKKYLNDAFPNIEVQFIDKGNEGLFNKLKSLAKKYENIYFHVGDDQYGRFCEIFKKYDFGFKLYCVVGTGERSMNVNGTFIRSLVANDDFIEFSKYIPININKVQLWNDLRKGMKCHIKKILKKEKKK